MTPDRSGARNPRSSGPDGRQNDGWAAVVGQEAAVDQLRAVTRPVHAYLLVGPAGSGKRAAARAFAADLLAAVAPDPERARRLALAEEHPDLHVVERHGPRIDADQARDVIRRAHRHPVEGARKVLVLVDFHLALEAAPILLKTVEEPPASTVMVVLAEEVPPELVTVASRCVRIDLRPLAPERVRAALEADGVDAEIAAAAAAAAGAGGDLRRARLLATDPDVQARRAAWVSVPDRLDGTGAAVARVVDELLALAESSAVPLAAVHAAELDRWREQDELVGGRGRPPRALTDRHKREVRRLRVDELRAGLAALAGRVRDDVVAGTRRPELAAGTLRAVADLGDALDRNPSERLLLQDLLLRLG